MRPDSFTTLTNCFKSFSRVNGVGIYVSMDILFVQCSVKTLEKASLSLSEMILEFVARLFSRGSEFIIDQLTDIERKSVYHSNTRK